VIQIDPDPSEHPECNYCREFLSPGAQSSGVWNAPILNSENFVVVPTLGHFVPGWLLIVPRKHYVCFGAVPPKFIDEFLDVKRKVEYLLASLYSAPIKFEHGPCSRGLAGACIDHAHMHFVPTTIDLKPELDSEFHHRSIQALDELTSEYRSGRPYFFYETAGGLSSLYQISVIPSQFARMLLARKLGMLEKYDWRKYKGELELRVFLKDLERMKRWEAAGELHA